MHLFIVFQVLCGFRPVCVLCTVYCLSLSRMYSFGIMMWEMVSRTPPFAGLHHGEVIHKVVTQDLRPGEGTVTFGWVKLQSCLRLAAHAHLC